MIKKQEGNLHILLNNKEEKEVTELDKLRSLLDKLKERKNENLHRHNKRDI